jgi:hypothetical protein
MAAGLGFKDFTTGEVLTAADVDGYLMQGIWVFANATARDAAVTAPAEGNFAFTKDNNSLWYYDGAAWVASGATGDIEGVTAGVGISGGGTSGTVTVTNSMATAIDAKGDLVVGTGADTFARLAVGTNGHTLVADSAEATGLKWQAPSSGGMTLLETLSLSGSSVTSSTISGSYTNLVIIGRGVYLSGASNIYFRYNGDTASNYQYRVTKNASSLSTANATGTFGYFGGFGTGTAYNTIGVFDAEIQRYSSTEYKIFSTRAIADFTGFGTEWWETLNQWNNTAAITSITIAIGSGTFSGGSVYIYGVK